MLAGVFVDRPRLAIVIAIVITLAGLISLTRLPVSQFPDIVPPQVQVTTTYPGASAEVVESTVAQVLEASDQRRRPHALHEVEQRQRRQLRTDGQLRSSAPIRTSTPSTSTTACSRRCRGCRRKSSAQGVTVQKRSSAILEFMQFYSEGAKQDPLFISNYVTINVLDTLSRIPGVGQASLFGALNYSMRIWFETDRLISLEPVAVRHHRRRSSRRTCRRRSAASARARRRADTAFQINLQTKGRLSTAGRNSATSWCAPTTMARRCGSRMSRGSRSGRPTTTA